MWYTRRENNFENLLGFWYSISLLKKQFLGYFFMVVVDSLLSFIDFIDLPSPPRLLVVHSSTLFNYVAEKAWDSFDKAKP